MNKRKENKLKKLQSALMDICIVVVLLGFYVIVDVVYPLLMFKMGIQLSDWWLAANVIVPLVELVCCMFIEISSKNNGSFKMDKGTRDFIQLMTVVISSITGQSMPDFTSGLEATTDDSASEEEDKENEDSC